MVLGFLQHVDHVVLRHPERNHLLPSVGPVEQVEELCSKQLVAGSFKQFHTVEQLCLQLEHSWQFQTVSAMCSRGLASYLFIYFMFVQHVGIP